MVFIFGGVSFALPSLHFIKAMLLNTAADLDPVRIISITGYRSVIPTVACKFSVTPFCTDFSFGKLI